MKQVEVSGIEELKRCFDEAQAQRETLWLRCSKGQATKVAEAAREFAQRQQRAVVDMAIDQLHPKDITGWGGNKANVPCLGAWLTRSAKMILVNGLEGGYHESVAAIAMLAEKGEVQGKHLPKDSWLVVIDDRETTAGQTGETEQADLAIGFDVGGRRWFETRISSREAWSDIDAETLAEQSCAQHAQIFAQGLSEQLRLAPIQCINAPVVVGSDATQIKEAIDAIVEETFEEMLDDEIERVWKARATAHIAIVLQREIARRITLMRGGDTHIHHQPEARIEP